MIITKVKIAVRESGTFDVYAKTDMMNGGGCLCRSLLKALSQTFDLLESNYK